ncbi:hypothetical protein [Oceanisphaera psychrotolerans]|uniref:Uncharacterized protein n=1 Tax=Oceanisphaera psychrotolerans TaxID=1414654 RepID=A0A1J4QBS1_9GAMM|nr:hypothetical protein [Oceanisphaera psychrotolerans]OIN04331.1 hypothetical protein BFR47_06950 [Oceanisphaera psychrotolerans]
MDIFISASNALTNWLGVTLPKIPSPDGKRVGTQPLSTGFARVSWQCHLVEHGNKGARRHHTVIAVEAYSRYAILLPFSLRPTQDELEQVLLERWGNEALHLALESGAINDDELPLMTDNYLTQPRQVHWFNNNDLSVNGHVADAGQWLKQTLTHEGLDYLDDNHCYGLGLHINQRHKKAGSNRAPSFRPVVRLLDDALFRFGSGLAAASYPDTRVGDFPCPYPDQPVRNNVVQLDHYRQYR